MSELQACLIAFGFCCLFALALAVIWRQSIQGAAPSTREALNLYRNANGTEERIIAVLLLTLPLVRLLVGTGLASIVVAAFGCLGAICGYPIVPVLRELRPLLLDFYNFVLDLFTDQPSAESGSLVACLAAFASRPLT